MEDMDDDEERLCAEDALDALLERLIDALLHDLSRKHYPDYGAQLIAKQLEAAAWLYYFYLHKSFPELEYYDPSEFCRKAVFLRLGLAHYVKHGGETKPCLAEARVQAACSAADGASTGGAITRVAVILLSKDRKSCLLVKSLITQGLWSFVEQELAETADPLDCAYSTIRENLGIKPDCLQLEQRFHHFRAMSQKGDNTRLYIMVCEDHVQVKTSSGVEEFQWMLLENLFLKYSFCGVTCRAKGDFISASGWGVSPSPAVDYFHIYPLVDYLHHLLSGIQPKVRAAVETTKPDYDLDAVELTTQNCTELNVKLTEFNACIGKKRRHEEEKICVGPDATLVVPDSDDDENNGWSMKKSRSESQLTQNSQLSSSSPNPSKQPSFSGLKETSPANKPSDGDGGKRDLTQAEIRLDGKVKEASQNESSNGAATLASSHEETLEQLQAKHLTLLQELKSVTLNYELQVSTLLAKIAESSARLQEHEKKIL